MKRLSLAVSTEVVFSYSEFSGNEICLYSGILLAVFCINGIEIDNIWKRAQWTEL